MVAVTLLAEQQTIARARRVSGVVFACLVAGASGSVACHAESRAAEAPVPVLASTHPAQLAYRKLESRWTDLPPERRAELDHDLRDFLAHFGADDRARTVRLLLAWIELDRGLVRDALALVGPVRDGPRGAVHDFADVVLARALLRDGKLAAALGLLEPLHGKLADASVRGLYWDQLVRALVAASRFDDAVHAMLDWADQASPTEREDVVATIEGLIRGMPTRALEVAHASLGAEDRADVSEQRSTRAEARRWLLGATLQRLTRVALTERDPELARRLLESSPVELGRDDSRDALSALAATSAVAPRVSGRAIGVVLDVTDDVSRQRSAQVVEGMTRALGLPATAARDDTVHLITRDASEPGDVERALAGLAGDGAAILVAGVTDEAAVASSVFAERTRLPVIVLGHLGAPGTPSSFTFSLGADASAEEAAIVAALTRADARSVARVGPGGTPCDAVASTVAGSRFPVQEWKRSAIDALVLAGDPGCTRDAAQDATSAGLSPLFVVGLESADATDAILGQTVLLGAGRFPFATHALTPDERAWTEHWGSGPSWYETLGHDAALLATAALADFPLDRADAEAAVTALHRRARDALSTARAALWSTAGSGFGGQRALPRDLVAVAPIGARP